MQAAASWKETRLVHDHFMLVEFCGYDFCALSAIVNANIQDNDALAAPRLLRPRYKLPISWGLASSGSGISSVGTAPNRSAWHEQVAESFYVALDTL